MKPATPALINLINGAIAGTAPPPVDFDLYTVTDFAGNVYRYTTADFDINCGTGTNYGGLPQPSGLYSSSGVRVDQMDNKTQAHWKTGLDADQWVVVMMPRLTDLATGALYPDKVGSLPFLQALQAGAWDAADVQVDRAYFATLPTWPMPPGGAIPLGTITIFAGMVAEVDVAGPAAVLTINDYRALASFNIPRNYYEGACRHMLFDAGCNFNGNVSRAAFAVNATVGAGSAQAQILAPGIATPGGSKTYTLGTLQMTSGLNENFWAFIVKWDGEATLSLLVPLPFAVAPGDTFTAYPGCDKTETSCSAFNNLLQFGGEPAIPVPETASSG
jgi:uncharacterized phage protein (TIGR02218 family)